MASSPSPSRHAGVLVKIETDRRLGHEWDEWNGQPLANSGNFRSTAGKFFLFTAVGLTAIVVASAAGIFLLAPRLAQLAQWLPRALYLTDAGLALAGFIWLALIGVSYATNRALLPGRFAERGLLLKTLRLASRVGELFGVQRDWTDNAAISVYNRLAWAREWRVRANDLLILIPTVSVSYGARWRDGHREALRCRDVRRDARSVRASGDSRASSEGRGRRGVRARHGERLHDVAGRMPVLGLTMQLPNGPCKDASLDLAKMEEFVRKYLR